MDDHNCDMCVYYDMAEEWCSRYRELHYPSDGARCPGYEFYKDVEDQYHEQN